MMKKFLWMILIGLLAGTTQAQTNVDQKEYNLGKMTLAIEGYDPVAYFTQKKAVKGNRAFAATHAGVLYYFSSEENKRLFLAQPTAYEPQYGGWCAYATGA
jgi:YHS domain-containing protein